MLKRLWILAAMMFVVAIPAIAQDYPKVEIFSGYSALATGDEDGEIVNLHGFGLEAARNFSPNFGLAGGFDLYGGSGGSIIRYLAGPRFSLRREKATLFVHALAGGVPEAL